MLWPSRSSPPASPPAASPGRAVRPDPRRARRWAAIAGLLLVAAAALIPAAPAAAHATLLSTDPADGSVVRHAVHTVSATFDEPVGITGDSLRVFDPAGRRVDVGGARAATDPATIEVALTSTQPEGTYTVAYQVVSADTHPVQGAFTFSIGHPSTHVSASSVVGGSRDGLVFGVYAVDRTLGYIGFAMVSGGLVFLALCWPTGPRYRYTGRWLLGGWLLAFVTTALQVPLQAALSNGRSLSGAFDGHLIASTLGTHLGTAVLVRLIALGFLAVLGTLAAELATPDARERWRLGGLYLLATALLSVTWSASGHAVDGAWWGLALVADMLHLTAAAVWLGGLGMLLALVLSGRHAPPEDERVLAATRFSPLALASVVTLVVTGTFQAWRNTRAWAALVDTDYGLLLCLKIFLLALLVVLGWQARIALGTPPARRRGTTGSTVDLGRLRRGVALEAALGVAVLCVTASLVQTPTAVESRHPVSSATRDFEAGRVQGRVTATVTPSRLGPNVVRIVVRTDDGEPYRPKEVTASMTQQAEQIGPLDLTLRPSAAGTFVSRPVSLDFLGSWTLQVVVRVSAFDETTVTLPVTIT